MKAGFFFYKPVEIDLLESIANHYGVELVGAYSKDNQGLENPNPKIFAYEDELLVQIEVAFIFYDINTDFDFIAKALKRGVNVFIASLPDCTHNTLLELNELSIEIGVPVGFGCAGEILIKQDEIVGNYFMLNLIHDMGGEVNDLIFRRKLIYDIASFVRIRPCGLRKFRVNGIPLFDKVPKAFELRLEYDNSSIITTNITRIDEPIKCELRFFSGNDGYFKELPTENSSLQSNVLDEPLTLLTDENYLANLGLYIQEIQSKSPLSFGIDNAIEALNIFESIEERLSPQV